MSEPSASTQLICAAAALAGGIVKGVLGMGLPMVAVPLLSMAMPVPQAIALLSVPTVSSNFWQTFEGGRFCAALQRFWTLLAALCVGIAFGTRLLVSGDPRTTQAVLGSVVIASALVGQFPPRLMVSRRL